MHSAATGGRDQRIRKVATEAAGTEQAVLDLHHGLAQDGLSLILLFSSPKRSTDDFAEAVSRRFPGVPVLGCTTAGEITPDGYRNDSIVGISFAAPDFHVAMKEIDDVRDFKLGDGRQLVMGCLQDLDTKIPSWPIEKVFAMLLVDGCDACEESVVSAIYRELGPIPLFGGSAGDDLSFAVTKVLYNGSFHRHGALLILIATNHPFYVFKTEHFASADRKMVVTGADPARRIVTEINAEPAAEEYARTVGVTSDRLDPMIFANHPVVVRVGNVPYVRSIQKVNADGSLKFYCAIDEGIVLTAAKGIDLEEDLLRLFNDIRREINLPEIIIGCECVLRNLEIRETGRLARVAGIMAKNNVVGFNTYGEQYQAMHVNQTFTGVAIGRLT